MKIRIIVVIGALLAVLSLRTHAAEQPAIVMKDARISWPGMGAHSFLQIAASPTNPDHVITCSIPDFPMIADSTRAVLYGSTDGGETWQLLKTPPPNFPETSEAACAIMGSDTIYFGLSVGAQLPGKLRRTYSRMYLWRSPDFGKSWTLSPHVPYSDAALLLVKKNAAGRDRVFDFADAAGSSEDRYLTIFDNDATVIRKIHSWNPAPGGSDTLHCGVTPMQSKQLFDSAALPALPGICINGVTILHLTDVGPNHIGALFTDWAFNAPIQRLTFTRVTDDGRPIGIPSVVARFHINRMNALPDPFAYAGFAEVALASGSIPGIHRERIYIAWHDLLGGRLRIVLSTSNDDGRTWSRPHPIDDTALRRQGNGHPLPTETSLAVNNEGVVAVSWMEFSGKCWRVAFSYDGGEHFGRSVPINPCNPGASFSLAESLGEHVWGAVNGGLTFRLARNPQSGFTLFDFRRHRETELRSSSLTAAADGSFYALWSTPGTLNDELHATHISFAGHDSSETLRRKNIIANAVCCLRPNGQVQLYYTSLDYDPATHEFEIGVVLARQRTFGGRWPFVLRIKKLDSALGPLQASNADNDLPDAGAAWVFDGPGSTLPPSSAYGNIRLLPAGQYDYSKPRMLRFRVSDDLTRYSWEQLPVAHWKARIPNYAEIVDVDTELLSSNFH